MSLRPRDGRAGFTLIELAIVLVLMALAVGLALPFMGRGIDSIQGAAAPRRLVSFMNDARVRAMNTGAPVDVVYDFEKRTFSQRASGRKGKSSRYQLPEGIQVVNVLGGGEAYEEGKTSLVFYPLGDSSGATFEIEDRRGRRYKLTIGMLFATPRLEKADNG